MVTAIKNAIHNAKARSFNKKERARYAREHRKAVEFMNGGPVR